MVAGPVPWHRLGSIKLTVPSSNNPHDLPSPVRGPTTPTTGPRPFSAAQESFPDDLDQSPDFDFAEPEPTPEDDFVQSWGA